jgi:hypothetical protein
MSILILGTVGRSLLGINIYIHTSYFGAVLGELKDNSGIPCLEQLMYLSDVSCKKYVKVHN